VPDLNDLSQVRGDLDETAHGAVHRVSTGGDPRQRHELRYAEGHGQQSVMLEF
jgi:hypothetical protein